MEFTLTGNRIDGYVALATNAEGKQWAKSIAGPMSREEMRTLWAATFTAWHRV